MNTVQKEEQELTDTDLQQPSNVVKLHPSTGGGTTTGNWLKDLPDRTQFLARQKPSAQNFNATKDFALGIFTIIDRTDKSMRLVVGEGGRQEVIRVDPARFVLAMDFHETVGTLFIQEVGDDDDGDRPL
jgi:hypothetical protein